MTVLFICTGCVLVLLNLMNIFGSKNFEKSDRIQMSLFMSVWSIMFGMMLVDYLDDEPSALDVYRGKTELQYNYKVVGNDTTITDSTVVFKQIKK